MNIKATVNITILYYISYKFSLPLSDSFFIGIFQSLIYVNYILANSNYDSS